MRRDVVRARPDPASVVNVLPSSSSRQSETVVLPSARDDSPSATSATSSAVTARVSAAVRFCRRSARSRAERCASNSRACSSAARGATADLHRDGQIAVGEGARDRPRAAEQEGAERRAVGDERHDDAAPRRERVHDVAHLGVVRQRVDRRVVQRLREHGATGAQHLAEEVLPVERRRRGEQAHQRRHLRRVGVRAGDAADRAVAVEQVHHRVVGELRQRGARDRVERARRIERLADQLSDAQQQVALLVGDDALGDVVDVRGDPFRRRDDADVEPLVVKEIALDELRRPALVHRAPQEELVLRAGQGGEHRPRASCPITSSGSTFAARKRARASRLSRMMRHSRS